MKIKTIVTAAIALFAVTETVARIQAPVLNRDQIRQELVDQKIFQTELRDNRYVIPSSRFIKEQLIPFYVEYARQNLSSALGNNALSVGLCRVFQSIAYQANIRGGGYKKGDVPVGVILTREKGNFDLKHKVILRTDKGWHVINPTDGQVTALYEFRTDYEVIRAVI